MVAYGGGGRLMFIAPLIAVLGVIAMLPFSNCGKSPLDPYVVYPACPNDFSQDLKNVTFYSSYLNINPLIHKEPGSGSHVSLSKNVLSGDTSGCSATKVKFIAEVHPPYIEGIDPYKYPQLAVYEYLTNSRTIYITLHSISGDTHGGGNIQYKDSSFFYRMNCDELDPHHYYEILYRQLFKETDAMLGLNKCFPEVDDISASQYGDSRRKFAKEAYQEACTIRASGVPRDGLPVLDCYQMLTAIEERPGSSYLDVLTYYDVPTETKPDPYTFACPYLSSTLPVSNQHNIFGIKEYYVDAVHPMVSFNVTYFTIDLKTLELRAKVYSSGSLLTTGKDELCPYNRTVQKDYSAKKVKLTSCDGQEIKKFITDINLDNSVPVTAYKAISITKGVVNDKPIFRIHSDHYFHVRKVFVEQWEHVCREMKLFKGHK